MTDLERTMYVALLASRSIVAATANVNPQAIRTKSLVDNALGLYKAQEELEGIMQGESDGTREPA